MPTIPLTTFKHYILPLRAYILMSKVSTNSKMKYFILYALWFHVGSFFFLDFTSLLLYTFNEYCTLLCFLFIKEDNITFLWFSLYLQTINILGTSRHCKVYLIGSCNAFDAFCLCLFMHFFSPLRTARCAVNHIKSEDFIQSVIFQSKTVFVWLYMEVIMNMMELYWSYM